MALTGSNRGDRHNRDMLINSDLLGVDGTAQLIEEVAGKSISGIGGSKYGTEENRIQ